VPQQLIETVKAVNATRCPEDSVYLRVAVYLAVMWSVIAVGWEGAISPTRAVVALAVMALAYVISYRRRAADNWLIKLALALGAVIALLRFFGQLSDVATLDEIRFPLADIFLWIQVLHSFDLPQRKDLNFSLGSSLAIMGVAASLAQDTTFLAFLVPYFVIIVGALYLGHESETTDGSVGTFSMPTPRIRSWRPSPLLWRAVATVLACGTALFLITPQPTGVQRFALPFSLGDGLGAAAGGGLVNPGFENGAPNGRSSGTAYHGFNEELDLRVRGDLNDSIVMRVRASAPAMLRGMIFDTYDGVTWTAPDDLPKSLGGEAPYYYPTEFRDLGPRVPLSQTFYIEAEQPNAIFAAAYPEQVFFPSGVSIDALGALRTGGTLSEGTVYSVIASRGAARPGELRAADPEVPEELERYLQLPGDLPARVGRLARRITAGESNVYDKVIAVEDYMRSNYRYSTASPVPPEGRDSVDHFLFDSSVGFCEQFASATTVMLRTLGIPARLVAGYTPGSRNPFSGYYEVRNSDAHTWVEVYFPRYGWYEFDPTFAVPPAEEGGAAGLVPLAGLLRAASERLRTLSVGAPAPSDLAFLTVSVVALWAAVMVVRRRPGRARAADATPAPGAPAGPVEEAWQSLEEELARAGRGRAPPETARELVARLGGAGAASDAFERERYADVQATAEETSAAVAELRRLAAATSGAEETNS
jgi:protein-glutamine gamma-glutamyltransferase